MGRAGQQRSLVLEVNGWCLVALEAEVNVLVEVE
jgi:hypothetical protein